MNERLRNREAEAAVETLLDFVGEDVGREGLRQTPNRVVRSFVELCSGYLLDPADLLGQATFVEQVDEMIVTGPFPFSSTCEHHLLPFLGTAVVAYVPRDGRITGLSKVPRAFHALAARLQVQERLTVEMADAVEKALDPQGVAVVVQAEHLCASVRGVRTRTPLSTSVMRGCFRERDAARAEVLALLR